MKRLRWKSPLENKKNATSLGKNNLSKNIAIATVNKYLLQSLKTSQNGTAIGSKKDLETYINLQILRKVVYFKVSFAEAKIESFRDHNCSLLCDQKLSFVKKLTTMKAIWTTICMNE